MQCAHAAELKTAHLHDETRVPTSIIAAIKSDSLSKSVTCITSLKGAPQHSPAAGQYYSTYFCRLEAQKGADRFCLLLFCCCVWLEVIRPAEDEVTARHGVAAESCVTDGFIAFIGEVHALQVDLELLCDVIIDAEIER